MIVDEFAFTVAETVDGLSGRRIVRLSFRHDDAAGPEKIAYALESRLPVDLNLIIHGHVESTERSGVLPRPLLQVLIEHRFPASSVNACCVGDHAVHIQEDCLIAVGCNGFKASHSLLNLLNVHTVASLERIDLLQAPPVAL